jgi:hypothetical protein
MGMLVLTEFCRSCYLILAGPADAPVVVSNDLTLIDESGPISPGLTAAGGADAGE